MSEVRGSGREYQTATAQDRPRGATLRPRSGGAAERGYPMPLSPRPGAVDRRSYPTPPRPRLCINSRNSKLNWKYWYKLIK